MVQAFDDVLEDAEIISDAIHGKGHGVFVLSYITPFKNFVNRWLDQKMKASDVLELWDEFEKKVGRAVSILATAAASGLVGSHEKMAAFDLESDFRQVVRDVKGSIRRMNDSTAFDTAITATRAIVAFLFSVEQTFILF